MSRCSNGHKNDHGKEKELPYSTDLLQMWLQNSLNDKKFLPSLVPLKQNDTVDTGNWSPVPQCRQLQSAFSSNGLKSDVTRAGLSLLFCSV